ncbi:hypothetical protein [Spirillospora sp. NPDC048819]
MLYYPDEPWESNPDALPCLHVFEEADEDGGSVCVLCGLLEREWTDLG